VSVLLVTAGATCACRPSAPSFELGTAAVEVKANTYSETREYKWPITVGTDSSRAWFVAYEVRSVSTGSDSSTKSDVRMSVVRGRGDALDWGSYQSKCQELTDRSEGCSPTPRDPRPVVRVLGFQPAIK
jgi:hypothetical protein